MIRILPFRKLLLFSIQDIVTILVWWVEAPPIKSSNQLDHMRSVKKSGFVDSMYLSLKISDTSSLSV